MQTLKAIYLIPSSIRFAHFKLKSSFRKTAQKKSIICIHVEYAHLNARFWYTALYCETSPPLRLPNHFFSRHHLGRILLGSRMWENPPVDFTKQMMVWTEGAGKNSPWLKMMPPIFWIFFAIWTKNKTGKSCAKVTSQMPSQHKMQRLPGLSWKLNQWNIMKHGNPWKLKQKRINETWYPP